MKATCRGPVLLSPARLTHRRSHRCHLKTGGIHASPAELFMSLLLLHVPARVTKSLDAGKAAGRLQREQKWRDETGTSHFVTYTNVSARSRTASARRPGDTWDENQQTHRCLAEASTMYGPGIWVLPWQRLIFRRENHSGTGASGPERLVCKHTRGSRARAHRGPSAVCLCHGERVTVLTNRGLQPGWSFLGSVLRASRMNEGRFD